MSRPVRRVWCTITNGHDRMVWWEPGFISGQVVCRRCWKRSGIRVSGGRPHAEFVGRCVTRLLDWAFNRAVLAIWHHDAKRGQR